MNLERMIEDCVNDSHKWFPGKAQRIENITLCMAGEVGEVANLVKKIVRGDFDVERALELGLAEEIIDCLIYLCNLMGHEAFEEVDWEAIWKAKRHYNEMRFTTDGVPNATIFPGAHQ